MSGDFGPTGFQGRNGSRGFNGEPGSPGASADIPYQFLTGQKGEQGLKYVNIIKKFLTHKHG